MIGGVGLLCGDAWMLPSLLVFAVTYALAVASPGPGVAAIVARVLARGGAGMPAFVAGFIVGDLFWFGLTAAGLTALAHTFSAVLTLIKYAGAAYLLYMAWKLWTTPPQAVAVDGNVPSERDSRLFLGGLALTVTNPKVMVFFLAILPTVISLETMTWAMFAGIATVIAVTLAFVFSLYVILAIRARKLFSSAASVRRLNRGTGVVMAGAAVTIATR